MPTTINQELEQLDSVAKAERINEICKGKIQLEYVPEKKEYRIVADPSTQCFLPEDTLVDLEEDGDVSDFLYGALEDVSCRINDLTFALLGLLCPEDYDEEGKAIDHSVKNEVKVRSRDIGKFSFNSFVLNHFTHGEYTETDFQDLDSLDLQLRSAQCWNYPGAKYTCEIQPVRVTVEPIPAVKEVELGDATNVVVVPGPAAAQEPLPA